jgi:hypothetical protein
MLAMIIHQKDAISNLVKKVKYYTAVNGEDALTDEQVNDLYQSANAYGLNPRVVMMIDAMLPDIYEKLKKGKSSEAINMVIGVLKEDV